MPDPCTNHTPSWFVGHWRDWHRGHGCSQDDGRDRSREAVVEIEQHATNAATSQLTDAELAHLRARTTSGDDLLVRALDELRRRRQTEAHLRAVVDAARAVRHAWRHVPPVNTYQREAREELDRTIDAIEQSAERGQP